MLYSCEGSIQGSFEGSASTDIFSECEIKSCPCGAYRRGCCTTTD